MSKATRTAAEWDEDSSRSSEDCYAPGEGERVGQIVATALRQEAGEVMAGRVGPHLTCPECGGRVRHMGWDGRCARCAGVGPQESAAERRSGRRWLYRCTAELLRKIGRSDRAQFYDDEADRLDRES